jgi:hypothetical protein
MMGPPSVSTSAAALGLGAEPARPRGAATTLAGVVLFCALGAATLVLDRQLDAFLSTLDEEILGQATRSFDGLLERQRDQLAAEVTVLADDNRIRATVLAPRFDEATVQDVIDDLRKASGATLLAVLDGKGRAQVVSGAGALREADLGASPSVKAAFGGASSDVWTLPDQVQVLGLAPVRSGSEAQAVLVKGLPLGEKQLASVEATMGVSGAVLIGNKVVARSSTRPELDDALRAASALADGIASVSTPHGKYLARVSRTSHSATAARVIWLVPFHHQAVDARRLTLLVWCPAVAGALLLLLLISTQRRTNGGTP